MLSTLPLILFLALAIRLLWMFTLPQAEAPDECTHIWVINYLSHFGHLPAAIEVQSGGATAVYGSLPPFGYLPHLVAKVLLPFGNQILVARLGSLVSGLLTVSIAWLAGRELFGIKGFLPLSLPLALVFHPQFVFVNSYANNDATAVFLSTLIVYLLTLSLKHGLKVKNIALIGFFTAWLLLAKYSGWTLLPVIALSIVACGYINGSGFLVSLSMLMLAASLVAFLSLWWFVRNYFQYGGDWLGTNTMYRTWALAFHRQLHYHLEPAEIIASKRWWRFVLFSFWGMFGYTNRLIWRPLYYLFLSFQIASFTGWCKQLIRRRPVHIVNLSVWSMMVLCIAFNLAGMVYASTVNLGGPQGRYLLISELPIMSLIIAGLSSLGPKFGQWAVVAFVVFTALVCFGSWLMLFSFYGWAMKI